jgi:hypothetical protein
MRKLIMILCLAVMALFLVSCAGKASLMSTNDCDKRCANRINPMEANYRNQISGLQGTINAYRTQEKTWGDSTKTIAKLTKENTQYQADISRLKEQLATANQKIALTQTTGTTPATCPAMTSIVTAPVTAAPTARTGEKCTTWTNKENEIPVTITACVPEPKAPSSDGNIDVTRRVIMGVVITTWSDGTVTFSLPT